MHINELLNQTFSCEAEGREEPASPGFSERLTTPTKLLQEPSAASRTNNREVDAEERGIQKARLPQCCRANIRGAVPVDHLTSCFGVGATIPTKNIHPGITIGSNGGIRILYVLLYNTT